LPDPSIVANAKCNIKINASKSNLGASVDTIGDYESGGSVEKRVDAKMHSAPPEAVEKGISPC
jgi:hypothetical protein